MFFVWTNFWVNSIFRIFFSMSWCVCFEFSLDSFRYFCFHYLAIFGLIIFFIWLDVLVSIIFNLSVLCCAVVSAALQFLYRSCSSATFFHMMNKTAAQIKLYKRDRFKNGPELNNKHGWVGLYLVNGSLV